MILAFHQLFPGIISPRNWDIPFCLFQATSVETIHTHVIKLSLSLGTESDICLKKLQKCYEKTRLRQTQKENKSQIKLL